MPVSMRTSWISRSKASMMVVSVKVFKECVAITWFFYVSLSLRGGVAKELLLQCPM